MNKLIIFLGLGLLALKAEGMKEHSGAFSMPDRVQLLRESLQAVVKEREEARNEWQALNQSIVQINSEMELNSSVIRYSKNAELANQCLEDWSFSLEKVKEQKSEIAKIQKRLKELDEHEKLLRDEMASESQKS